MEQIVWNRSAPYQQICSIPKITNYGAHIAQEPNFVRFNHPGDALQHLRVVSNRLNDQSECRERYKHQKWYGAESVPLNGTDLFHSMEQICAIPRIQLVPT